MTTLQRGSPSLAIFREAVVVFAITYIYAFSAMYLMRSSLLPAMTSQIEDGHLGGDPQYYHSLALALAEKIKHLGIAEWELRPEGQGPAGVVSLIYVFTASQVSIVALNSFLHSIATCGLYLLLREWFSTKVTAISSLPFALSLYQIHWFSQVNKDSYVACGVVLVFLGVSLLAKCLFYARQGIGAFPAFFLVIVGALLISIARPFVVAILQYGLIMLCGAAFVFLLLNRNSVEHRKNLSIFAISVGVVASLSFLTNGAASDRTISEFSAADRGYRLAGLQHYPAARECFTDTLESWREEKYLPRSIDAKIKALFSQRCLYFMQLYDSNAATRASVLDSDIRPFSAREGLLYLPRAIAMGVFSPFPSNWFDNKDDRHSVFYSMASMEALILYLALPGFLIWIAMCCRDKLVLIPVALGMWVMLIYGIGVPYIGALYRYRYPFWMIIMSISIAGSICAIKEVARKLKNRSLDEQIRHASR